MGLVHVRVPVSQGPTEEPKLESWKWIPTSAYEVTLSITGGRLVQTKAMGLWTPTMVCPWGFLVSELSLAMPWITLCDAQGTIWGATD